MNEPRMETLARRLDRVEREQENKSVPIFVPKRIRTSDLLIGNQIPSAQLQQIKSFHDPATTVHPL